MKPRSRWRQHFSLARLCNREADAHGGLGGGRLECFPKFEHNTAHTTTSSGGCYPSTQRGEHKTQMQEWEGLVSLKTSRAQLTPLCGKEAPLFVNKTTRLAYLGGYRFWFRPFRLCHKMPRPLFLCVGLFSRRRCGLISKVFRQGKARLTRESPLGAARAVCCAAVLKGLPLTLGQNDGSSTSQPVDASG